MQNNGAIGKIIKAALRGIWCCKEESINCEY